MRGPCYDGIPVRVASVVRIADEHAQLKQLEKGQGKRGAQQPSKPLRPPPTTARSSGATSSLQS